MPMSSEALLGSQARPPTLRVLCTDKLCQLLTALRHWWSVTSSHGYRFETKRRIGFKASVWAIFSCVIIGGLLGPSTGTWSTGFDSQEHSLNPSDWLLDIWKVMDVLILPMTIALLPYDSLWLDFMSGFYLFLDYGVPLIMPHMTYLGSDFLVFAVLWMQAGGLHSLAALPAGFVLGGYCALGRVDQNDAFFLVFGSVLFALGVFGEWQGASGFRAQQEMDQMKQLLLDQATDGQCTLCPQSCTVRDASRAFMESLGPNINGTKIFDFVIQDDWAKVTSLLHSQGTLPPSPMLGTFLRRPILPGAPTIQFEAKVVPYAVSKGGIHVCLQKVGEERAVEAPAARPRGQQVVSFEAPEDQGEHSAHARDTPPELDLELGTEVSFNLSRSSVPSRNRRRCKATTSTIAVQTDLESSSARPPLMPGPPPPEPPLQGYGRRGHRRARHRHSVRLNNSKLQVPGLEETPLETRIHRFMDAMDCINARGEGCCTFHVSIAAAKRTLGTMATEKCRSMFFGSMQCPECFALLLDTSTGEEGTGHDAPQQCDSCGKSIYPLTPRVPMQDSPGCSSQQVLDRNSSTDGSEFKITIDRRDGASLGIDAEADGVAIVVHSVSEGLVQQWNESHKEAEVRDEDRFVEVNGIRGGFDQLIAECQQSKLLEIVVHRTASRAS